MIIGGGYAGLLTAQALSEFFQQVTVVERDLIAEECASRNRTPQRHHSHGAMARWGEIIEELFPGIRAELAGLGAPVFDFGMSAPVLLPTGWTPRVAVGFMVQTFSWAALDACIRRRVLRNPRIRVLDGHDVCGILLGPDIAEVKGIMVRPCRTNGSLKDSVHLGADLVVEAGGRSSRLPKWLAAAGRDGPQTQTLDVPYAYASQVYEISRDAAPEWSVTQQMPYAPTVQCGGVALRVDHCHWFVTLMGAAGDLPTGKEEFADFARGLRNPHIAQIVAQGTPVSHIHRFTNLANRWHRYDRQRDFPDRLLVIGDAFCTLNPAYGQGLTVAAIQVLILRDLLRGWTRPQLDGLAHRFQRKAGRSVRLPWTVATSSDLGWAPQAPRGSTRAIRWYMSRAIAALPGDPHLYRHFCRVQHMIDKPTVLLRPELLRRVFRRCPQSDATRDQAGGNGKGF